MDIDDNRIDYAVLVLLLMGLHDGRRAWKSSDWDTLDRLHAKGFISDPVGDAKSVMFRGWTSPVRFLGDVRIVAPTAVAACGR